MPNLVLKYFQGLTHLAETPFPGVSGISEIICEKRSSSVIHIYHLPFLVLDCPNGYSKNILAMKSGPKIIKNNMILVDMSAGHKRIA